MKNNSVYRRAAAVASERFFKLALGMGVTAVLARGLGVQDFGFFATGLGLLMIGQMFCAGGLDNLIYVASQKSDNRVASLLSLIVIRLTLGLTGILSCLLYVYFSPVLSDFHFFILLALSPAFLIPVVEVFELALHAEGYGHRTSLWKSCAFASSAALKVGAFWLTNDVLWVSAAYGFELLLVASAILYSWSQLATERIGSKMYDLRGYIKRSLPLVASASCIAIYTRADLLILAGSDFSGQAGLYAAAAIVSAALAFIPTSLIGAAQKYLRQEGDGDSFHNKTRIVHSVLFYITLIVFILWVILGELFISIVFSEGFEDAYGIVSLQLLALVFSAQGLFSSYLLIASGRGRIVFFRTAAAALSSVLMGVAVVDRWGGIGLAYVSIFVQFLSSTGLFLLFDRGILMDQLLSPIVLPREFLNKMAKQKLK